MRFTHFTIAGAFAALASAQTFTDCNPTAKDCPNDPAMAATFDTDFRKGAESVRGWKQTAGSLTYSQEGAQFTINKKGDAPTIQSETYLFFGYVEVKMKASPGQGIISSIVLQSEDLDEVDWEFIGGVPNRVQSNFFGKGNTTTYDRMIEYPVSNNAQSEMHTYALDWTAERLVYIIDGTPVRTLNFADPKTNGGRNYPQTPSTVRIGIWAGGDPSNEKGVIEWAGGPTDYTKAPFTMTVESVKVKNYSPGKEYKWTDKSGKFQSIEVVGKGDVNGAPENSVTLAPTASVTQALQSGIDVPKSTKLPLPSGKPAESGVPQPSATPTESGVPQQPGSPEGSAAVPQPQQPSTTCTDGQEEAPYPTTPIGRNGTFYESPCNCDDIATVTVTGVPPAGQTPTTLVTSSGLPVGSPSAPPAQPPVNTRVTSSPPYPTGGIQTDTKPAPNVPLPTGGFPASPSGNSSAPTPSTPLQFPGAASTNKAGVVAVLVVAAAMLVY